MTMKTTISFALFALTAALTSACAPYKLEPPSGYAEVNADDSGARMKAGDDVGLNLAVFDNVDGGTLVFWSEDLIKKLARRGYTLLEQKPAKSRNGVAGTRFDFGYVPPGSEEQKFYSVVLFVSDRHVFALQLAGDDDKAKLHLAKLDDIAHDTVVRGCKSWTPICHGEQPKRLVAPAPAATATQLASEPKPAPAEGS